MPTVRPPWHRRLATRVAVALGHALLALAVLHDRMPPGGIKPSEPDRIEVTVMTVVPPARTVASERLATRLHIAPEARRDLAPSPRRPESQGAPDAAAAAHVDWAGEAQRVARAARQATPAARTDCEDTDRPGAMKPRCTPRLAQFGWGHEPQAVEFAGILPYVHLGKRCILGLGFFGCGIGKLPGADGHLFDGRTDPNRPRSSVPEGPAPEP